MLARTGGRIASGALCGALLSMCLFGVSAKAGGPRLPPIELGSLGASSVSEPRGINDDGMVVGISSDPQTGQRGFAWTQAAGIFDLGSLGRGTTFALALNNDGVVVGLSGDRAFRWTDTTGMVDLGTLGGQYSYAEAINSQGLIVGISHVQGESHAFGWTEAEGMFDLGTLGGGTSSPKRVTDSGMVVGYSTTPGDVETHAFMWTRAEGMVDLGTLGGSYSEATGANNSGLVVGWSTLAGDDSTHAFVWTREQGMVDLGTLGGADSFADAVNDSGVVIGYATLANSATHAFVWTSATGMLDIGTLGGSNSSAVAINDNGQVIGSSDTSGNALHAFAWTSADGMVDLGTLHGYDSIALALNDSGTIAGAILSSDRERAQAVVWPAAVTSSIAVNTNLAGATFQVVGPRAYSGSGTSFMVADAPVGTYSVLYGAVAGFVTPPAATQPLPLGGSVSFSGTYVPSPEAGKVLLNVRTDGSGGGTVLSRKGGIDCGATCVATFKAGSRVVLEAVAAPGSTFVGWSDSFCKGTLKPCAFSLKSDQTISATFVETPQSSDPKIIYVGICGAAEAIENSCLPGFDWYDPRDVFSWVDPLDDADLDALGKEYSGLDAIGLRIAALFPQSVTLVTSFSAANVVSDKVRGAKDNVASIVDFVKGVYSPGDRVFLVGHSAGGAIVQKVANELKKTPVEVTAQIDAIGNIKGEVAPNVARAFNFYYPKSFLCPLWGLTKITAAKRSGTSISNDRIDAPLGPDALASFCGGHRNMDNDLLVWRPILNYMVGIR
jgi:probable HAF family extracellular repeat protein